MTEEYIYLIRTREFANHNDPTYKIGRTTRNVHERINEYPLDTEVILMTLVNNCIKMERTIIKIFDYSFVKRTDLGLEYYSGDVNYMKRIINSLIQIHEDIALANVQKPVFHQKIKLQQQKIINNKKFRKEEALLHDMFENLTEEESEELLKIEDDNHVEYDITTKDNIITELSNTYLPNDSEDMRQVKNIPLKVSKSTYDFRVFVDYIKNEQPEWYTEFDWILIDSLYKKFKEICKSDISKDKFSKQGFGKIFSRRANKKGRAVLLMKYSEL